jgi:hypothetical protein
MSDICSRVGYCPSASALSSARRNLLQGGFCGKRTFETFLIDIMKRRRFSEVVEIDRCENDVVKVHVRFLEIL